MLQRVGKVAYKLELLTTSNIHHVFHVYQLKKAEEESMASTTPPPVAVTMERLALPKEVLQVRTQGQDQCELLVLWEGLPK